MENTCVQLQTNPDTGCAWSKREGHSRWEAVAGIPGIQIQLIDHMRVTSGWLVDFSEKVIRHGGFTRQIVLLLRLGTWWSDPLSACHFWTPASQYTKVVRCDRTCGEKTRRTSPTKISHAIAFLLGNQGREQATSQSFICYDHWLMIPIRNGHHLSIPIHKAFVTTVLISLRYP